MTKQTEVHVDHQQTCPHCGYCPTCGRSNRPQQVYPYWPQWPYGTYQPYPWWSNGATFTSSSVTSGGNAGDLLGSTTTVAI